MEEIFSKRIQKVEGSYLQYHEDEVILSNGNKAIRELVVHPGAVSIAALTDSKEIIMVRQFRYPVGQVLYEIPAGKLEKEEEPLICAKRELQEETGFKAEKWARLSTFYTAPGFANETMHFFLAQDLTEDIAQPDDDELIEFEKVSLAKAGEMVRNGDIKDAKTILAVLWVSNLVGIEI